MHAKLGSVASALEALQADSKQLKTQLSKAKESEVALTQQFSKLLSEVWEGVIAEMLVKYVVLPFAYTQLDSRKCIEERLF